MLDGEPVDAVLLDRTPGIGPGAEHSGRPEPGHGVVVRVPVFDALGEDRPEQLVLARVLVEPLDHDTDLVDRHGWVLGRIRGGQWEMGGVVGHVRLQRNW